MSFFGRFNNLPDAGNDDDNEPVDRDVPDAEFDRFVASELSNDFSNAAIDDQDADTVIKKRKRDTATKSKKTAAPAVVPPRLEFDTTTLGGRELDEDRGWFRATMENAQIFGEVMSRMVPIAEVLPLTIAESGISVDVMDTSHVTFVTIAFPRASFIAFENIFGTSTTIHFYSKLIAEKKAHFQPSDTLTIGFQEVPSDAKQFFLTCYPRSGDKNDGFVYTNALKTVNDEIESLNRTPRRDEYQHKIVITYTTLLDALSRFKACSHVVYTLAKDSLTVAGRSESGEHSLRINYVKATGSDDASVEEAFQGQRRCYYERLHAPKPHQPIDIVNFRVSHMFIKRTLMLFSGCRFIRMLFGRGWERNNGEFLPVLITGTHYSPVDGRELCTITAVLANAIEDDN